MEKILKNLKDEFKSLSKDDVKLIKKNIRKLKKKSKLIKIEK